MAVSFDILADVVRHYRLSAAERSADDAWWRYQKGTLSQAISQAALANSRSGKHSHQWRIPEAVLRQCGWVLRMREAQLAVCWTFEDLFEIVERALGPIVGAGELLIYDTADRIGQRLGLAPSQLYLHAGTRLGARALGLPVRGRRTIALADFPTPLNQLQARELEDILCTYKNVFSGAKPVPPDDQTPCGKTPTKRRIC